MSTPPFTVRAVYPYESDVEGDLVFDANQLITVEVIEDSEWYTGSYLDSKTKQLKSGMFPINFVEPVAEEAEPEDELEPEPQAAPVPTPAPVSAPVPTPVSVSVPAPAPVPTPVTIQPKPKEYKPAQSPEIKASPIEQSLSSNSPPSSQPETTAAPKKRNAFQDRIAAFNSSSSAPTPFAQPKPTSFVKKPFYAAPTNSYIPQIPHIPKPAKPTPPQIPVGEIVHHDDDADEDEKPVPKVSLKDRIRLLQEQQQAEAARAEALAAKKKQKKAAKKAEHDDLAAAGEEAATSAFLAEGDADEQEPLELTITGGSLARTLSVGSAASHEEFLHPVAQTKHQHEISSVPEQPESEEIETKDDDEEESDEDEEDEEEARKQALRERMAKISGGMGMHLGMIMPGGFGAPAPSRKPKKKVEEESVPAEPSQAPIPIFPFANPASMPEVLQHPPRAETESSKAEEKEDLSDETASYVEIESKNDVEDLVPGKSEPASHPISAEPHSDIPTEPIRSLPQSVSAAQAPASIPEAAPPASKKAVSTLNNHQQESFPTAQSSRLPPPVSQEQLMQSPTSHALPPPVTTHTSVPPAAPITTSPPALHAAAPPVPASERKLDSVIASHKEDSDTEESDSAWSDSEPSHAAPRRIPPVLAPPPPLAAPSVSLAPVPLKQTDISGKFFKGRYLQFVS
jgi:hypothetical protein